jgi:hypothetical protein
MSKTSISSDTSPNLESGATDSPWQPSWWQWLISALSGTLEIERQIAWLEKSSEAARQRDEELRKSDDEARQRHELRMSELRKENERLAVLESKIDGLFSKYNIKLPQGKTPEQP